MGASGDLLDTLLNGDDNSSDAESEVGEATWTYDNYGNKVYIQEGGAPKKRKSSGDTEGFKLISGHSSKVQRVRFIDEEIRGKKYRMESSSVECSVFDTVVKQIKDLVQKSKDSPKECIDELFKNVSNKDLTKAIPALAGHNKVELRIKQLVDLTMPFVDNDLGEVLLLKECCDTLVKRSMEGIIVNLFGSDDGSISWEKLYDVMSKEPKNRKKRSYNRFTGHLPSNNGDDDDAEDDEDDDDDDDDGDEEGEGCEEEDTVMPDANSLIPYMNGGSLCSQMPILNTVSIATPKKGRGRPKKSG